MEAAHPKQSNILLCCGQRLTSESPIDIRISVDFFSQKNQNRRFNLSELLKVQVPLNSIVFELETHDTDGEAFAKEFLAADLVKQANDIGTGEIKCYGNGNKAYVVLQGSKITEVSTGLTQFFGGLKSSANNENNEILFRVQSQNDLKNIGELLFTKNLVSAYMDSLQISIDFRKTQLVEEFLATFFEGMIGVPQLATAVRSFSQLNLEFNLASSKVLDEYPKVKLMEPVKEKVSNSVAQLFRKYLTGKLSFSWFNQTISVQGNGVINGLEPILSMFYL